MNIPACTYTNWSAVFEKDYPFCMGAVIKTSFKAAPEGKGPATKEEEVEREKMQANPAYLPIEIYIEAKRASIHER